MSNLEWSGGEKKVARRIFDAALKKECAAIVEETKRRAAAAQIPEDIWALHDYLTAQRSAIDDKYDFRYSQLIFVFGRLLRESWLDETDLEGLRADKRETVKQIAAL